MNYAVPRILHEAGILERLFTDFYAKGGVAPLLRAIPAAACPNIVRRMLGRAPEGIPPDKITAFTALGIEYACRVRSARSADAVAHRHLWGDQRFCKCVNQRDWGGAGGVFTFNVAGLETLKLAKERGLLAVMEQCSSPADIDHELVSEEKRLHPEWEGPPGQGTALALYSARERAEWALADRIICGSEFVRENIKRRHGPWEKCLVVPYGVTVPVQALPIRNERMQRIHGANQADGLRVLSIGRLELRKGICSVWEAAQVLGKGVTFRWIGGSRIRPAAREMVEKYVHLGGDVPRAEIWRHYGRADVFLLPSVCEGSATVTYEALSMGLPVICTANAGSPVQHGQDGFIVPLRDPQAIAARLEQLNSDRNLLRAMSRNALERAKELSVSAYGNRLLRSLDSVEAS